MRTYSIIATLLALLCALSACVTGSSKASQTKSRNSGSLGGGLESSHVEGMGQSMKSSLSTRLKNLGECKDSMRVEAIENRTGVPIDMKQIQTILTRKLTEAPIKLLPDGRCKLFGALTLQQIKSPSSSISTYSLTVTIEKHSKEMVWSDRQEIKLKR